MEILCGLATEVAFNNILLVREKPRALESCDDVLELKLYGNSLRYMTAAGSYSYTTLLSSDLDFACGGRVLVL